MQKKHNVQLSKVCGEMKYCPVCEFQNTSISRIRAHVTIYHSDTPGNFQCDQCNFVCRSKSGLRRHVIAMHKLQEDDNQEVNMDTRTEHYNPSLNNVQSSVQTHAPLVPQHPQTYVAPHSETYVLPHPQASVAPHSQTYVPAHPPTNLPSHSKRSLN